MKSVPVIRGVGMSWGRSLFGWQGLVAVVRVVLADAPVRDGQPGGDVRHQLAAGGQAFAADGDRPAPCRLHRDAVAGDQQLAELDRLGGEKRLPGQEAGHGGLAVAYRAAQGDRVRVLGDADVGMQHLEQVVGGRSRGPRRSRNSASRRRPDRSRRASSHSPR